MNIRERANLPGVDMDEGGGREGGGGRMGGGNSGEGGDSLKVEESVQKTDRVSNSPLGRSEKKMRKTGEIEKE